MDLFNRIIKLTLTKALKSKIKLITNFLKKLNINNKENLRRKNFRKV